MKIISCQATELTTTNGETLNKVYFETTTPEGRTRTLTAYVSKTQIYFGTDVMFYLADLNGLNIYKVARKCAKKHTAPYDFMHSLEELKAIGQTRKIAAQYHAFIQAALGVEGTAKAETKAEAKAEAETETTTPRAAQVQVDSSSDLPGTPSEGTALDGGSTAKRKAALEGQA